MQTNTLWKRSGASLYAIAMFTTAGIAAPALAQAAPQASSEAATDTGEILVTARKREESLLKVPVTVTAMTSERLEARGVVSMQDVAASTPGISINNNSSGHADRSFQQVVLRGFTPSTTLATTVSLFIDGVAVSSPSAFTAITDPERIEILKGPQSAYFGRNTFAGAINVVNKVPKDEWAGEISGTVGTRDNYRIRGALEGPIFGDVLTFRVTGEKFSKSGSWTNAADGTTLGDQSTRMATALLVFKPLDGLTMKLYGMLGEDRDGAPAQSRIYAFDIKNSAGTVIQKSQSNCTLTGNSRGIQGFGDPRSNPYICGTAPGLANPVSANVNNVDAIRTWLAGSTNRVVSPDESLQGYGLLRKTRHAHTTIDYEINDKLTASVLAGYNREVWTTLIDLDGYDSSSINTVTTPAAAINPRGYFDFPFLVERKLTDWSLEGRLAYDAGPFRGVAGVSYLKAAQFQGGGGNSGVLTPGLFTAGGKSENKTTGLFFGLTYDLTSTVTASVEGRYQIDKLAAYARPGGQTILSSAYIPAGTYASNALLTNATYKNFTPRVILNWQATPDTMLYASWAKGVNPAQFNTSILAQSAPIQAAALAAGGQLAILPEKITNYEVGMKGRALGGALRYSAAAYFAQWKNQINAITIVASDPAAATGFSFVNTSSNTGNVNLYGFEVETTLKANKLITIDAAAAINNTNIRQFKSTTVSQLTGIYDFSGKQMKNTSKYSANVGIMAAGDIVGTENTWFARFDWNFKSGQYSNEANIVKTHDLHLFNARTGVTMGKVSVDVFVNNVFNNHTYNTIADNFTIDNTFTHLGVSSALLVGLPELRTAGLQVKVKF